MWVLLIIFWIFNYTFTWLKKYTRVYSENMQHLFSIFILLPIGIHVVNFQLEFDILLT